jgi:hypothetical protein
MTDDNENSGTKDGLALVVALAITRKVLMEDDTCR